MRSPFPGMDPYLEDPRHWRGLHTRLINAMSDVLADRVAPHFFVDIETRVYIAVPEELPSQQIVPDIHLIQNPQPTTATQLLEEVVTAPTLIEPMYPDAIREHYLEIRDTQNREVVTTIELFSPFNKAKDSRGQAAFLRKRKAVMHSATHWIEIDLLLDGERIPELAGRSDYYALLQRGKACAPQEVWFFDLRDRMPTIAVPLREPFADVPLNLQTVFDTVYARAHYAISVDYTRAVPNPQTRPADTNWAAAQVQAWRQRTTEE